jgi:hypothetical protein
MTIENILTISGVVFLSLLAALGVVLLFISVFLLIRKSKKKEKEKSVKIFKLNFQEKLIRENNNLINVVDSLIEESLELAKKNEFNEEYSDMKKYSISVKESINKAFETFRGDNDIDNSLASLSLLKIQLENMAEQIDENISLMREKLGEERVIN